MAGRRELDREGARPGAGATLGAADVVPLVGGRYHARVPPPPNAGFSPQSPWLDLINSLMTDGFGHETDHLSDPQWVVAYLRYWERAVSPAALSTAPSQLRGLRAVLRSMVDRVASGERLGTMEIQVLNAHLRTPSYAHLTRSRSIIALETRAWRRGWPWVRSQIVATFVEDLLTAKERIKVCGNPDCGWAFRDDTKGNTRRWCRDRRCGNRLRVRRSRARSEGTG